MDRGRSSQPFPGPYLLLLLIPLCYILHTRNGEPNWKDAEIEKEKFVDGYDPLRMYRSAPGTISNEAAAGASEQVLADAASRAGEASNLSRNIILKGGSSVMKDKYKPLLKPLPKSAARASADTSSSSSTGGSHRDAVRPAQSAPPPGGLKGKMWDELMGKTCSVDFSASIKKQLEPWASSGIEMAMLDQLYCIRKQVSRVSIRNGELRQVNWQLNMDHNRLRSSFWLIQLVLQRAKQRNDPLPDVEMIVNPTDKTARFASGRQQTDAKGIELRSAPLMCNVKCENDTSISFPLYYHTLYGLPDGQMSLEMYNAKFSVLERLGTSSPWDAKKDRLFFSATNARGHRAKLFDIKSPYVEAVSRNVPLATYGEYKYNVYTYGHSGWSRRLRELMFMNTTVFMEHSSCNEFFFGALQSGIDYVPVSEDLEDLQARVEAVAKDPETARKIAANFLEVGPKLMRLECILDYIEQLLRAYAKLQRFAPPNRSSWNMHTLKSGAQYFLTSTPPKIAECRPYF